MPAWPEAAMRVTSALWVEILVRRCGDAAVPVYVVRSGAAEAGAIFVTVEHPDRLVDLYGPAPQALVEETGRVERRFERVFQRASPLDVREYLDRQLRFDSDLWLVDIEHRDSWPVDHLLLVDGSTGD